MDKVHEKVWKSCLTIIKDNVSPRSFQTWFEPSAPIKLKSKVLTIQVPSQFFYEWLEEHYVELLKKTVQRELGQTGKLEYSVIIDNHHSNQKPYTVKIPTTDKKSLKNPSTTMPLDLNQNTIRNPFIIPGLQKIILVKAAPCAPKITEAFLKRYICFLKESFSGL